MEDEGDSGSDGSYESAGSEGGNVQDISKRGRDEQPRIIASSHCVEVYRRLKYGTGPWAHKNTDVDFDYFAKAGQVAAARACRELCKSSVSYVPLPEVEERAQVEALAKVMKPHDPLEDLPKRIMRFDGLMEEWLEEVGPYPPRMSWTPWPQPLLEPFNSRTLEPPGQPITTLAQAAHRHGLDVLKPGNQKATIWYATLHDYLHQIMAPALQRAMVFGDKFQEFCMTHELQIQQLYVELGRIHAPSKSGKERQKWLEAVAAAMQANSWSPRREALQMEQTRQAKHVSMSVGDCIQVGIDLYLVDFEGFVHLSPQVAQVLLRLPNEAMTKSYEGSSEDEEDEVDEEEEYQDGAKISETTCYQDVRESVPDNVEAKGKGKGRKGGKKGKDGDGKKGGGKSNGREGEEIVEQEGGKSDKKGKGKKGKKGKGKGKNSEAETSGKGNGGYGGYPPAAQEEYWGEGSGKGSGYYHQGEAQADAANGEAAPGKSKNKRKKNKKKENNGYDVAANVATGQADTNGNSRWVPKGG